MRETERVSRLQLPLVALLLGAIPNASCQAAKNKVDSLSLGGGSRTDNSGFVVSYTADFAAAASVEKDGSRYPSVLLGDGGVLGKGRVLAFGKLNFLTGDTMDGTLKTQLFTEWAFRGKAAAKVVVDLDWGANDIKTHLTGLGATVEAEGLQGYSNAAGLKAKLEADGIDTLVLSFRSNRGGAQYPTDGYESAILDWMKAGGSVIAGGSTTSWTWNYHNGGYRQDTCRLFPGNKIFETVGLLWYCQGYTYGYESDWIKITETRDLSVSTALGELAVLTPTTVLTAQLPGTLGTQLSVLLVCSPCSGTDAVCTDVAVYDDIWSKGIDVVEGPCEPTYNGPFPLKKDDGWRTCTTILSSIFSNFPNNKQPSAALADAAKRYPGSGYDLDPANRKTVTQVIKPYLRGWHSTGCYAPPGVEIEVQIPKEYIGKITSTRIGVHSDSFWSRDEWKRFPNSIVKSTGADENGLFKVLSVWGGPIWVNVDWSLPQTLGTNYLKRTPVELTLKNVHRMLWYEHGVTTEADWDRQRAENDSPFADFQCRTETYAIPHRSVDLEFDLLYKACEFYWDRSLGLGENEMVGQGGYWDTRTEIAVFDVQTSAGYMHSGYPWVGPLSGDPNQPKALTWGGATNALSLLWGGTWGDLHEMGHNHDCCAWSHKAPDVHTNVWVCQGYHETPQWISRCHSYSRSQQMDRYGYLTQTGGPCTYDPNSDNGVPANGCDLGLMLKMHTTIMSQLGFGAHKKHLRRGNHLQTKAGDGAQYYDEQAVRFNYALGAQTQRDVRSLYWSFSYNPIPKLEYRNAVLLDKPLTYIRFSPTDPTELGAQFFHGKADAARTRPAREGPGAKKTTFTTTATVGEAAPGGRVTGESATFDGTQNVIAALEEERACDGAGSVEVWMKADAAAAGSIVQKQGESGGAVVWKVGLTAAGKPALQVATGTEVDAGAPAVKAGAWTHIVVSWGEQGILPSGSGYSVTVYVDAKRYGPVALAQAPAASAAFEYSVGDGLRGALAELAVFCSALTPDQVGLHFHGMDYFTPWAPNGLMPDKWTLTPQPECAEEPSMYVGCNNAVAAFPGQAGVCQYCSRRNCPGVKARPEITCLSICDEPTTDESHAGGCNPNMCLNGGTCAEEAPRPGLPTGGYSCACKGGFSGNNCELGSPSTSTGTPTTTTSHEQAANTAFEWMLKLGKDTVADGIKCDSNLWDCPDYVGGERDMVPTAGQKKEFMYDGRSRSWEWEALNAAGGVFPDDQTSTGDQRARRVYYMAFALYVNSAETVDFQFETAEGVRIWIGDRLCKDEKWGVSGLNDFSCGLESGWNQVIIKARKTLKLQAKKKLIWALQIPDTSSHAEEHFFRVPHPKRSVYPTWWTSSTAVKGAGLTVTFDYPRYVWFGDGEMLTPRGKIVPVGQCGTDDNGLGGAKNGFDLEDETYFTTTAGIASGDTTFDVCFWHPACEQWRKVGPSLEVAGAGTCGTPPECWTDDGGCKWSPLSDGSACGSGICLNGACAKVTTADASCPAANPDCKLRRELSVATARTGGALVQDMDSRFEPWGSNGLPHSPSPIYASPGLGGIMVAWTVNDPIYTRMHQIGKLGRHTIRVSFFDQEMQRVVGRPEVHITGGTVSGFTASEDGRFAILRWSPPDMYMERFDPDGTRRWSIHLDGGIQSQKVGDARLVSLPQGGEDYYAAYFHSGKESDHYAEVDSWGVSKADTKGWCNPSYRHELAAHPAFNEVLSLCVGEGIRVRTWKRSKIDRVIHDVPSMNGWGRAAGDIGTPVTVADGFWVPITATKTPTTTYNRADNMQVGLVHIKWEAGTWQVRAPVWVTDGASNEVAPRLWPFGTPGESTNLLVGWQEDVQDASHMTGMKGDQKYKVAMFNTDEGKGDIGILKDDQDKEVVEEVTDAAVWTVHAPGFFQWNAPGQDGSAGWVYSWKPGAPKLYEYTDGSGCAYGHDDVCDGGIPPVRNEPRVVPSQPGEPYLQIIRIKPPNFNCTDDEKKLCQNQTSCEKRFGRVTCQCPLGHANKAGVAQAQWGYVDKCEDQSCATRPANCGTNATCRDIHHPTKPFTCECPPSHPLGDPDTACHLISRGGECSKQPSEPLLWGPLTNLLHYGTKTTNIGGGIGKSDHFSADDGALEPRLGEEGPGSQKWNPEESSAGQWGQLTGSNWYTTAFSLALYSPLKQKIELNVQHDIAAKVRFGQGWKFNAPIIYNNGSAGNTVLTLDFVRPGWYWLFIKFYDDFNSRSLKLEIPQPVGGATEWPMLGWCYDLPLLDECAENYHNCAASAICTDTPKYFECECPPGTSGDPPSGFNGDPTKDCTPVEGEPLMPGAVTKLLAYGGDSYNLGGGVGGEKFSKKQSEMTPVTGDAGPSGGEVWRRVERPGGQLPYAGSWHTDAFSLALWSPSDQTVDVKVTTAPNGNAAARIYVEGKTVFDASNSATVPFPLKQGWNQVFIMYYVDQNYRSLMLEFDWNNLGWWYEKPLINECANGTLNDCLKDANCIDTPSGYECHCKVGFAGDGIQECLPIEGEPLVDGIVKKTLRYSKKAEPDTSFVGGGLDSNHFGACCGGDAKLRPRIEEEPGAISNEWWWGKWQAPEYNGVEGNLVTTGQPNWYTDIFSWAIYSPKDQEVDLIGRAQCCNSRVWVDGQLVNEAAGGETSTKVTLTKGWHQVVGKFYANYNGRTFTVNFNSSNLGWAYEIPLINECQLPDRGGCHADANCVDTPESYYCECKNGFGGDGITTCEKIEGQILGCGKITKLLKYGDESFNYGGGIDKDKFADAGMGKEKDQRPKTGGDGWTPGQKWTQVERGDGNLPYGGNWHADMFAMAVYSPADNTEVTLESNCAGTSSGCRMWSDGTAVDGVSQAGVSEGKVTLSKGWHQWIFKYYVDYNARTFNVDVKSPCTLGWFYEIPDNDSKCIATVCKAQGQCRETGICTDNSTGECSDPPKTDGAACNDGNTSTIDDQCKAGECVGTDMCAGKNCDAAGECQEAGSCNPQNGLCVYPTMMNGASCNDGLTTTVDDTCMNGTCSGVDKCAGVTCTAKTTCHEVGVCDHQTGFCSEPVRPDGALCNDSLVNTVEDVCTAGICRGVDKCVGVFCEPPPACHGPGGCDAPTGLCVYPLLANGTLCDDGNIATIDDTCTNGFCAGKSPDEALCPASCALPAQCAEPPTCEGPGMVCTYSNRPNGYPCDDGDVNTADDRCFQGQCLGSDKCINTICRDPGDQCMEKGVCDPTTGNCTSLPRPDGAACDDGDASTADDQCRKGVCGGNDLCPQACDVKACHDAGTCDPNTGLCSYNASADLSACDSNGTPGECIAGTCQPKDFCRGVTCTAKDTCHDAGTCNRTNGNCTDVQRPDGSVCQGTGTCTAGVCSVAAPTVSPTAPVGSPTVSPSKGPLAPGSPTQSPVLPPSMSPSKSPLPAGSPTQSPVNNTLNTDPTKSPNPANTPTTPPSLAPTKSPLPPGSPTQSPQSTTFDECAERQDPCGNALWASGGTNQTCVDPNPTTTSLFDFTCACANGAMNPNGTAIIAVNGPAVCRKDECQPVNPCGDDQDCYDPDTTADKIFDYTCTCKAPAAGSGGIKSWQVGTRARCEVDECASQSPCGPDEECQDTNLTSYSSSQSVNASGFRDFTCSCKDGSRTSTGVPANCSDGTACQGDPCGSGQTCSQTSTGGFVCACEAPSFGTADGAPAVCYLDECNVGSVPLCGLGQACHDDDTSNLGTFNCTCLPPWNGSKIGAPADCWHDDCRSNPCDETQVCVDDGPGFGTFFCECKGGYKATNRAAKCIYDECAEREETKNCTQCFDPHDSPSSVSDYRCFCEDRKVEIGSPCKVFNAADLEGPAEKTEEGSDWLLVVIIAGSVACLACLGAALLWHRRRVRAKFTDIGGVLGEDASRHAGTHSMQDMAGGYKDFNMTPRERGVSGVSAGPSDAGTSAGQPQRAGSSLLARSQGHVPVTDDDGLVSV
eukprot:Hpha_TRINITY_DN16452_c0_g3::TRINITY_DN16452_c0_g3_i1::g.161318::m.161318